MVVKPYQGITGGSTLVQPGIKCRGREYLALHEAVAAIRAYNG